MQHLCMNLETKALKTSLMYMSESAAY